MNNTTLESAGDDGPFTANTLTLAAILFIPILILSIVGNVLVLFSVCVQPTFSKPANFMLANLSMNYLLQISSMLSFVLHKRYQLFSYGPWTCHLFPIVHACAVPVEGFTIMCISLERSNAVLRPLERESGKSAVRKIAMIWIAALLIELPHGFFWKYVQDTPSNLKCVNTKELLGYNIPYVVYACAYFLVVAILPVAFLLKESVIFAGRLKFLISLKGEWSQFQVRSYKLIRNALFFILVFICFKLPSSFVYLIVRMPKGVLPPSVRDWAKSWQHIIFNVGAFNGCIYAVIIFALSNKMPELFACFTNDSQSPPPARTIYRKPRRRVDLPLQPL